MGLTTLVANSIIPSIIIHFMNNFLSNYFFYGSYLDWPFVKFVNFVTNLFMSNMFIFIISSIVFATLLLVLYIYLLKWLMQERAKNDIQNIIKALQMEKLSLIQAQIQLHQINALLKRKEFQEHNKKKPCFSSSIFLISSFILGTMITISSFIWGVI